ncbi:Zinc finger, RanBP2-type domain-containing protein [Rozella allomycis CSF55]|uniref:Vacuolar protein-sorting-associated protein 36 n=1 Tax=Rozella allomycis (strain CSF55) TaxID=988480 RepID=A0A075AY89_ROZAC|nr:Zinc finger, RanBP2-type domain-containing protein [Rozella allomycis CSF55]|eukprot:EPZ35290.1 Zinc finger, RanBP2-type domain-containing protein [Rozella allomycis CSF55]
MDCFDSILAFSLFKDEAEYAITNKVGLYDRETRLKEYDSGILRLTNQRMNPFLRSHGKIILFLNDKSSVHQGYLEQLHSQNALKEKVKSFVNDWACEICNHNNQGFTIKCESCGVAKASPKEWPCSTCTFLNKIDNTKCEMCGSAMGSDESLPLNIGSKYIKLSFRDTGFNNFVKKLQIALEEKTWYEEYLSFLGGIVKKLDNEEIKKDQLLNEAFKDLDSLMRKASEMINMAKSYAKSSGNNANNVFASLGLEVDLTNQFDVALARQIIKILDTWLDFQVVDIVDLYCILNKQRGTELLSPKDVLNACEQLSRMQGNYRMRRFESGDYEDEKIGERIQKYLDDKECFSAIEFAAAESLSIEVATEFIKVLRSVVLI